VQFIGLEVSHSSDDEEYGLLSSKAVWVKKNMRDIKPASWRPKTTWKNETNKNQEARASRQDVSIYTALKSRRHYLCNVQLHKTVTCFIKNYLIL
jgi:hypothetical protein